ncbi:hypothetical protein E2C01_093057 [Portunus trituberculatus]|uniref:Uncharacterized protein n=1 Tax=Portunus trituberculatus TaxID=210409 RepID=A0A5B7JXL9_PORTR|nr:hypothetical protein [Portunus trituberculatus]
MSRTQEHQTFPEKFTKLSTMPNLLVAMTEDAMHRKFIVEDSASPSGRKFVFEGYMVDVMDYVAQGINFSYVS